MNNPGDPNLRVPSLRSSFLGSWFRGQFLIFGIQGTLEEKQLNEIIANFHPDTAALRRHMIEYGILERNSESVYWVSVSSLG